MKTREQLEQRIAELERELAEAKSLERNFTLENNALATNSLPETLREIGNRGTA